MEQTYFSIQNIPAILLGEKAGKVFLFVHGKCGTKEEAIPFADLVCAKGYQVVGIDLPEHGERANNGGLYPWKVIPELIAVMEYLKANWKEVSIRANSIGAWFCLMAFQNELVEKCLFVSPILDMKKLIRDMMTWASVTETQLEKEKEIPTAFGETLSWEYYTYVKDHPVLQWISPTYILYADNDNLTDRDTADNFAGKHASDLTVMENGEHWFHTDEQLAFLRKWEDKITG